MKIINLLPKEEQILIKKERILSVAKRITWLSACSYILVVAILIGAKYYMQQSLGNLDSEIKQQQEIIGKQSNTALKNQIAFDNTSVQDYNDLAALEPNWSKVLEEFVNLVPSGVNVKSFKASSQSGQVDINGAALTRQGVLDLRSNILNDPMFSGIDLPLDNLQQPTNLTYHYTFFVDTKLLQADPKAKIKLPPAPAKSTPPPAQ